MLVKIIKGRRWGVHYSARPLALMAAKSTFTLTTLVLILLLQPQVISGNLENSNHNTTNSNNSNDAKSAVTTNESMTTSGNQVKGNSNDSTPKIGTESEAMPTADVSDSEDCFELDESCGCPYNPEGPLVQCTYL